MKELRITKYNPENRDSSGAYLDHKEWTSFSEVGLNVSKKEYETVESNYIESAKDLVSDLKRIEFTICGLEDQSGQSGLIDGSKIEGKEIERTLRGMLREEYWCRLESEEAFIHIGWDYYMYVGIPGITEEAKERILNRGLYVENFISPYHLEKCEQGRGGNG